MDIKIKTETVNDLHRYLEALIDTGLGNLPVCASDQRARYPFLIQLAHDAAGQRDTLIITVRPDAQFLVPEQAAPDLATKIQQWNEGAKRVISTCGAFAPRNHRYEPYFYAMKTELDRIFSSAAAGILPGRTSPRTQSQPQSYRLSAQEDLIDHLPGAAPRCPPGYNTLLRVIHNLDRTGQVQGSDTTMVAALKELAEWVANTAVKLVRTKPPQDDKRKPNHETGPTQAYLAGKAYKGSATRDGFRVVWEDGYEFDDGVTHLYAVSESKPGEPSAPVWKKQNGKGTSATVEDLALLTRLLVHHLKKTDPQDPIAEKVLDFLRREGLQEDDVPNPSASPR